MEMYHNIIIAATWYIWVHAPKKESKFSSGRSDKTIKIACADYFILIQLLHSIGHNDRKMKWVMSSQHSPMYSPNREM